MPYFILLFHLIFHFTLHCTLEEQQQDTEYMHARPQGKNCQIRPRQSFIR